MKKLIFIILMSMPVLSNAQSEKFVVIVNKENAVDQLSLSEVRIYWLKRPKKKWDASGKLIKPADYKNNLPVKSKFYQSILRLTEADVDAYFIAKQYQNGELPPVKLMSEKEVINYVGNEAGAIGFISRESLTESDLQKVKIVYKAE